MSDIKTKDNNGIIDLSLNVSRQRIRIDGDDNKILLLNLSDLGIVDRLNEAYPKLKSLEEEFSKIETDLSEDDADSEQQFSNFGKRLKTIDNKMRELIDYVFDSNVCEVCVGSSSLCSVKDGHFFYETIISSLSELYSAEIARETTAVTKRINKHTAKYSQERKRGNK